MTDQKLRRLLQALIETGDAARELLTEDPALAPPPPPPRRRKGPLPPAEAPSDLDIQRAQRELRARGIYVRKP